MYAKRRYRPGQLRPQCWPGFRRGALDRNEGQTSRVEFVGGYIRGAQTPLSPPRIGTSENQRPRIAPLSARQTAAFQSNRTSLGSSGTAEEEECPPVRSGRVASRIWINCITCGRRLDNIKRWVLCIVVQIVVGDIPMISCVWIPGSSESAASHWRIVCVAIGLAPAHDFLGVD